MTMGPQNTDSNISNLSRWILVGFAIALLFSVYLLFTLPSDLRYKGNVPSLELVTPILIKVYISLAITGMLALVALYLETKRVKIAIVYKEKSSEITENKAQSESGIQESLDSKSIGNGTNSEMLTKTLNALAKRLNGVAGACYICKEESGVRFAELINGFALPLAESEVIRFNFGDGFVGQVAKSGTAIYVDEIPEDYYQAESGLGNAKPKFILVLPVKRNGEVKGVLELATFKSISIEEKQITEKFTTEIGERLS